MLHQFHDGYGPDKEEIEMFKLAMQRLKKEGDGLLKDVHWGHYPSDILLHACSVYSQL